LKFFHFVRGAYHRVRWRPRPDLHGRRS